MIQLLILGWFAIAVAIGSFCFALLTIKDKK